MSYRLNQINMDLSRFFLPNNFFKLCFNLPTQICQHNHIYNHIINQYKINLRSNTISRHSDKLCYINIKMRVNKNSLLRSNKLVLLSPTVKDVLLILGVTGLIAGSLLIPTLPMAAKPIVDFYKKKNKEKEFKEWEKFNQPRLKFLLKRLYQQKVVDFKDINGQAIITLTDRGKKKVLSYQLEEIMIDKPPKWDGKWRVIIYDIKKERKILGDIFRRFLQKMQFLKLQKSVYITPYPCDEQIEFLRQYYGLGEEILYIIAEKIENGEVYKKYFGL